MLDAGYPESALKDVIAIVALFSFYNRLLDGYGVTGNDAMFARNAEMLHNHGYLGPPV